MTIEVIKRNGMLRSLSNRNVSKWNTFRFHSFGEDFVNQKFRHKSRFEIRLWNSTNDTEFKDDLIFCQSRFWVLASFYRKPNRDEHVKSRESFHDLYSTLSGFNRYKFPFRKKLLSKHFIEYLEETSKCWMKNRERKFLSHKKLIMQNYVQIKIISEKFQFS